MAGSETERLSGVQVRTLAVRDDFEAAVRLEQEVWGFSANELVPAGLFAITTKIGGQVFGAFDGPNLVGFCFSIPGLKAGGKGYLHSHLLAVREGYRDRHIGRAPKLAQREEALARGIDLIEWTFDPLETKNAFFNMERLGAVVRRYVLNQYGMTSSPLHGGLPTDRCVAEWWLASRRVEAAIFGAAIPRPPIAARIEVPENISRLRHEAPAEARRIQAAVSDRFVELFRQNLAVIGVERSGSYLLGPWHFE